MKAMVASACLLSALAGTASAEETAKANFIDMAGQQSGTATLTQTPEGVLMESEVPGLPAGDWVAFHVHENGTCEHAPHPE
ncbi:MAG: superoxide dismutase family protein, partial [Rhizobiaceae bacterium]|nr:superoxide dismutase family protein [Rhizobiaceae bacterium]